MTQSTRPIREFTGRHMLMIMIAFFGVIVAVNFTMAWLASHSWTGLVVKNSYVASQKFNDGLRQARKQSERGWRTEIAFKKGLISFRLTDRIGRPVDAGKLQLSIGRPATEAEDRVVALQKIEAGHYAVKHHLNAGVWAIAITGGRPDQALRYESRLTVGADEQAVR